MGADGRRQATVTSIAILNTLIHELTAGARKMDRSVLEWPGSASDAPGPAHRRCPTDVRQLTRIPPRPPT
jgi:hypothetical protein